MDTLTIAHELHELSHGDGYTEFAEELDFKTAAEQAAKIENILSIAASATTLAAALFNRYHGG